MKKVLLHRKYLYSSCSARLDLLDMPVSIHHLPEHRILQFLWVKGLPMNF